ncbi:MAG TPA: NAD(P)-dependent oxidoreductase [Gemmatimonadaceae bacterium]|jgi:nucleoside-diphosphate-sugar epimerase
MAERVFVTGATGVIGRRVVPELVRLGYDVTAVGRTDEKRATLAKMGATAIAPQTDADGRISTALAAKALVGHTAVVNLATHMPPTTTKMLLPWEWTENDRVRRDDSAALVEAALTAGVRQFIQESFALVYEEGGDRWIDESFPQRPVKYNRTVLDAEASATRFTAAGGVGVVMRFAGFYGPDRLLRDMVGVVKNGWSPLPGRGDAFASSVAHEDAARAVVIAVHGKVGAGAYNICDDEPLRRAEWVSVLAAAAGAQAPKMIPAWLTKLAGSGVELLSRSLRMSNATFKRATGWSPRWPSVREGLPDAIRALDH